MAVDSPCIGACWIEEATGWCRGCGRTRAEVAAWPTADDARRRAILAQLPARLARARAPAAVEGEKRGAG